MRDNLTGGRRSTHERLIPSCMFTDPPLARIGLSERQARRDNIAVRIVSLQAGEILRTRTTGETRGFLKALVDEHSDEILGFTMFGADAGQVLAAVQTVMNNKLPYQTLRDAILTHPTMAEGLNGLFSRVSKRAASMER
ncbi:MAG: Dihydrolipoyl dehydrogenase [Myxococcaceae bacterium]|nr:Dihydrolipoyl dehydrogenase [Myxococcaceae bacterium]